MSDMFGLPGSERRKKAEEIAEEGFGSKQKKSQRGGMGFTGNLDVDGHTVKIKQFKDGYEFYYPDDSYRGGWFVTKSEDEMRNYIRNRFGTEQSEKDKFSFLDNTPTSAADTLYG